MIAPIREPSRPETGRSAQRRKARRWIVESLLSRPDVAPTSRPRATWTQWACAAWICGVAATYFWKMLGGYFFAG